jgi:predicted DNA-binding WGR domain protein
MKKKVKLPKNWGKISEEGMLYFKGFDDGYETAKRVMQLRNLKAKKKK